MLELLAIGDALPHKPLGAFYATYNNLSSKLFAAVDTGSGVAYYVLNTTTRAWDAVTGPTVNPGQLVQFAGFGDDVLTVGGFTTVWIAAAASSNFVTIAGSPASIKVIIAVNQQVLLFTGNQWISSAIGDDTNYVADVATLSATGRLYQTQGPIIAGARLYQNAVAFKNNSVFLGQQSGPPFSWSWEPISTKIGTFGQGCVIELPDQVVFLGTDDFYSTTGYAPQIIPNNVKQWFFRSVNDLYLANTIGWYDHNNQTVYWHYVSDTAPNPPICDAFVSYNTRAKRWCVGHLDVSAVASIDRHKQAVVTGGVGTLAAAENVLFNGDYVPMSFEGDPAAMVIQTGWYGQPSRMLEVNKVYPKYNKAPTSEVLIPFHARVLGQPATQSPQAVLGEDGGHNLRQTDAYHQFILQTAGDCEIIGFTPEARDAGVR